MSHSAEGARQYPGSRVHMTTHMLSSRASAASHGLRKPNGGRNHIGGAPSAFLIAECVKRSSTRISADPFQNRFGCDSVWFPMAWPRAEIWLTNSGHSRT